MVRRAVASVDPAGYSARRPLRLLEWEDREDGLVTVLRPKFGSGWFGRWMGGRLKNPHLRIKLDSYGSFIWQQCDGLRSVTEIAAATATQFDELEDLAERLPQFFAEAQRVGMIGWDQSSA